MKTNQKSSNWKTDFETHTCTLNLSWKFDNQYYHPPSWKIKIMTSFMNDPTERESCPGWHATFLLTVAAASPSQA